MVQKNRWYNKVPNGNIILKSSDKREVCQWIYDSHYVEWWITFINHRRLEEGNLRDKVQDIYEMIMNIPQEKLDSLFESSRSELMAYIIGLIKNQLISTKSSTYYRYDKYEKDNEIKDEYFWSLV